MTAIVPAFMVAHAQNATRWAAGICTLCGVRARATRDGWCAECYAGVPVTRSLKPARERALLDATGDFSCCGGKDYGGGAVHRAGCYELRED